MGITIEDGKGRGILAGVTEKNQLLVDSSSADLIHFINHSDGQAYSLTFAITPTGANDCFCYIKNTSTNNLNINTTTLAAASDEVIQVKLKDTGTPVGGATATPVNRNTSSNNTAIGTFQTGVDITGLSGGSVVDQFFIDGATNSQKYSWASTLIIGQNQVATLYAVTGAIALRVTIALFYEDTEEY